MISSKKLLYSEWKIDRGKLGFDIKDELQNFPVPFTREKLIPVYTIYFPNQGNGVITNSQTLNLKLLPWPLPLLTRPLPGLTCQSFSKIEKPPQVP